MPLKPPVKTASIPQSLMCSPGNNLLVKGISSQKAAL
jgi:hypothetical protein